VLLGPKKQGEQHKERAQSNHPGGLEQVAPKQSSGGDRNRPKKVGVPFHTLPVRPGESLAGKQPFRVAKRNEGIIGDKRQVSVGAYREDDTTSKEGTDR
jgi:hypothetical protein